MLSYIKENVSLYLFHDLRYMKKERNDYPIKIAVCFHRKVKYFPTGISLTKVEWDNLSKIKKGELLTIRKSLEGTFFKYQKIIDDLVNRNTFSFDNLKQCLGNLPTLSISELFKRKIQEFEENDQIGSLESYRTSLKSFQGFDGRNLEITHITIEWLKKYENYMLAKRSSYSTIGIYLRNLRTVINYSINKELINSSAYKYPFGKGKYEIPCSTGHKRALSLQNIAKVFNYKDFTDDTVAFYKDLWVFSYLCNGANFNDICRLKFGDINDNEICFLRGKTKRTSKNKKEIIAYLTDELKTIINRWGNPICSPTNYIFPFLKGDETPAREKAIIRDVIKRTNKRMKRISDALELPVITTYTARHSYATVLKRSGTNIAFICESLGHSDLKTTENYLASFETEERKKMLVF